MKREVLQNPFISIELKKTSGCQGCVTLNNASQPSEGTLLARRAMMKSLLTALIKQKCIWFAKKYGVWTKKTGAMSCPVMKAPSSVKAGSLWHSAGTSPYESHYTMNSVKHPHSVLVLGSFSGK